MSQERQTIKCKGRFHELRELIYNLALPMVADDRKLITEEDLETVWDLIKDEIFHYDLKDPYFASKRDVPRKEPVLNHFSIVPLIESPVYGLDHGLVRKYALAMGNKTEIADSLEKMNDNPLEFFRRTLGREPGSIILPGTNSSLSQYVVSANVGIGTIVEGGVNGGGIVSDSPFILGVHKLRRTGKDLAAVIGFWPQDNSLFVSQMQSCRNAKLPEEAKFGEACLYTAEVAARQMGFEEISTYTARSHPIFMEHPDSKSQLEGDFVCLYDNSAKKLGYDGGRHGGDHSKSLKSHR